MALPALARRLLVVVVIAAAVSGCSGGDEPLAEVAAVVATPTEVAAPAPSATLVPTATAVATPTTAPTPEPTLGPVERAQADLEEIKAVHTRFMTELSARDERNQDSVDRYLDLARELTAGEQLDQIETSLSERRAADRYVVDDGAVSNVGDIQIYADGLVEIFDCSRTTGVILDESGASTTPPTGFEWRSTHLRLQRDGVWRVVGFDSKIDEPCDPAL